MSAISKLPLEVQKIIFNYLNISDKVQCMLVCSNWRVHLEKLLYKRVVLTSFSQLELFYNTLERREHLGRSVQRISFWFENDESSYHQYAKITKLLLLLPMLEYVNCEKGSWFDILADTIVANQLPHLFEIEASRFSPRMSSAYISCALLLHSRLKSLEISLDNNTGQDLIKFHRLFDKMHQFKHLQRLSIRKETNKVIELIEEVMRQCPSLQQLDLYAYPFGNDGDTSDINIVNLHTIITSSNLKKLDLPLGNGNPLFVPYIMQKFPHLEELNVVVENTLDQSCLNKFLVYMAKMANCEVSLWSAEQQSVDFLGLIWRVMSRTCTLHVSFNYDFEYHVQSNSIEIRREKGSTHVVYHCSVTPFISYTQIIEQYGSYIDNLELTGVKSSTKLVLHPEGGSLYDHLIVQPLQQCEKLKKLVIIACDLLNSHIAGVDSRTLDCLELNLCTVEGDVLYRRLSMIFDRLEYLILRNITYKSDPSDTHIAFANINLTETHIGKLLLSANEYNDQISRPKLLLSVSIQGRHFYYMYDFDSMNDSVLKTVDKVEPLNTLDSEKYFKIDVTCKSLRCLDISYAGKILRLINH